MESVLLSMTWLMKHQMSLMTSFGKAMAPVSSTVGQTAWSCFRRRQARHTPTLHSSSLQLTMAPTSPQLTRLDFRLWWRRPREVRTTKAQFVFYFTVNCIQKRVLRFYIESILLYTALYTGLNPEHITSQNELDRMWSCRTSIARLTGFEVTRRGVQVLGKPLQLSKSKEPV